MDLLPIEIVASLSRATINRPPVFAVQDDASDCQIVHQQCSVVIDRREQRTRSLAEHQVRRTCQADNILAVGVFDRFVGGEQVNEEAWEVLASRFMYLTDHPWCVPFAQNPSSLTAEETAKAAQIRPK